MIDKKETKIFKAIAILIVEIAHLYRYERSGAIANLIGSLGFFGAALFAFLSGYGVEASYRRSGIYRGWGVKKIKQVFLPFFIVNVVSILLIYKDANGDLLNRILMGSDDFVLWYVPFILGFYCIFYLTALVFKDSERIVAMSVAAALYVLISILLGLESNWYSSTFALMLGIYVSERKASMKYSTIPIEGGVLLVLIFVSQYFEKSLLIKETSTLLAGCVFTLFCVGTFKILKIISVLVRFRLIRLIGAESYWLYLTHMKTMKVIASYSFLNICSYLLVSLLVSLLVAFACMKIYDFVIGRLDGLKT